MGRLQTERAGFIGAWTDIGADFCPPFSDYRDTKIMVANIARSFVVPADNHRVFFQITPAGATYWVDDSKTAVIPSDISDGSAPEMNPAGRQVIPGQTLSVITSITGAIIQANYYN